MQPGKTVHQQADPAQRMPKAGAHHAEAVREICFTRGILRGAVEREVLQLAYSRSKQLHRPYSPDSILVNMVCMLKLKKYDLEIVIGHQISARIQQYVVSLPSLPLSVMYL